MLDEKIILEESEVKFEHRLNNVFGNNRPIAFNKKYTALNSGNHGEIILYNKNKENVPQRIKLDNNDILDLEFSPFNNEHLALYTKNNIISIYDLSEYNENDDQMKPKYTLNPKNEITLMTFNPAKSNILCICDKKGNMCIWDINADKTFNQLNQENDSTGLLWSPNGNLIAICFNDGLLKIYNIIDNKFDEIFEEKISQKDCSSNFFTWLNDNSFATIGLGEDNFKYLSIWNNFQNNDISILGDCSIYSNKINEADSDIIPFSNKEHNLIYLVNKKEDNLPSITVYEFNEKFIGNEISKKSEYFSAHSAAFSLLINSNYCDDYKKEIDRFIRYNSSENKIYFASIFKKGQKESELLKTINDLEKENNELKMKLTKKDEENNSLKMKLTEKDEENNSLKKAIEDNNNNNKKIIDEQKDKINTYEQEKNELEKKIDELKNELDSEQYRREIILANKILEKEKEILNIKLSLINNVPQELPSSIQFSNFLRENKGIFLKLNKHFYNRDNNLNEEANEQRENNNQVYKIYNLDVNDKNEEILMIFGNDIFNFTFDKYEDSMIST